MFSVAPSQLHVSRDNLAYELRDTKRKCEQAYIESSSLRRSLDNCRADLLKTQRECFSLNNKLKNSQKELQRTTDTLKKTQDELQKSSSASSNNNDLVAEVSRLSERYKAEGNSSRGDCEVLTTKIKRLEESSHHECSQPCRHMQRISVSQDKLRHSLKKRAEKASQEAQTTRVVLIVQFLIRFFLNFLWVCLAVLQHVDMLFLSREKYNNPRLHHPALLEQSLN